MTGISINKKILSLALPAVLYTITKSSFSIIDAYWVGKLGSLELAGLTVATFIVWGVISLTEVISLGLNALVAQSVGAKDFNLSKKVSTVNITNSFLFSILIGWAMIPVIPGLFYIMGLNDTEVSQANQYLIPILIGLPCLALRDAISAVFRGYGDTKTPFYLLLFAVALNFFTTPLLIFGIQIGNERILQFGLSGAAFATLFSYLLSYIIGYVIARRRDLLNSIKKYTINLPIVKETFKIGTPVAVNGMAFSMIYVFVARFVAQYESTGLAAMGIGHKSESVAFQICMGFTLASTIMVGHSFGAGKKDEAENIAWRIVAVCGGIVLVYSIGLFMFSSEIASIFTSDLAVINAASDYNKFASAVLIFTAVEVVLEGAFSGAGDTMPPAIITMPFNILRIPLAALLSPGLGLNGIWLAIAVSNLGKGILMAIWFKRGKWKLKSLKLLEEKDHLKEIKEVE